MITLFFAAVLLPVANFVTNCLDGAWEKLETFSLGAEYPAESKIAKSDWLTSPERLQDPDDMILSRAMYRALWGMERPKYRGDTMNTFRTVLGRELTNGVTKADRLFKLSDEFKARRAKFYYTYHTLGNYIPLPNDTIEIGGKPFTLNMYRAGIWKDYFGEFLVAVKTYLEGSDDEKASLPADFKRLMEKTDYFWQKYRGKFKDYVRDFYLQDYLDEKGEIIRLQIVYWWQRGQKEADYIAGATKYLDFAERVISLRSKRLIEALKK